MMASTQRRRTAAILDDISERGACLQLEHPIPAQTMVKLICGRSELSGTVRSCRYRHCIGYYIGIAFAKDCSWSKERYRPRHLFDPRSLSECQPAGCTDALSGHRSSEKVRKVAREVARVCRNLDLDLVKTCYRHLYEGHRSDQLLDEFVDAYYEALNQRSRGAEAGAP
ncbi:MAG: hypothetical protein GY953_03610 [bacterium]|nr:hypothetical protein [bacterium]